jgi:elongation factor Ts
MNISIELLKQLRQETGAGIQDCRKALDAAEQDYGKALGVLRRQSLEEAARRADRPAYQGFIEMYSHGDGRIGVMVEVNSETDFAARSAAFRSFAREIALQVAASSPLYVRDEDIPTEVIAVESQKAAARAREEGKPEAIIPRIVEGFIRKYKDRNVLLRQPYIRDETISVDQLLSQAIASVGENIVIRRFARWELSSPTE